jgi:23S rRNA pseudouridine1911/1915/1917 synthase
MNGEPKARALRVVYEDNHLLAVDKPAGLLTQPSGTAGDNLEARAKAYVRSSRGKSGAVFLHAVHRLDRSASGVVLFARTSKALSRLSGAIRERRVRKVYRALVEGRPPRDAQLLRHAIRHRSHRAEVSRDPEAAGKEASLAYRVLRRGRRFALLEIELHTGRYHQIRAQLAASGMPVAGDRKYGASESLPGGGIALHHALLEIEHPVRKERIRIEAPVPANWPPLSDPA